MEATEDSHQIREEANPNFDEALDKFDHDHADEDESKQPPPPPSSTSDEIELKPKKAPRSARQVAAFEKAREARRSKIAERKAKEAPPRKKVAAKKPKKKTRVVYQEPTSSDDSEVPSPH